MIPPTIAPRLSDDPAWVRYEFELRHLPFLALRDVLDDLTRQIGDRLLPAVRNLGEAFTRLADTAPFLRADALEGQT